VLGKNKTIKNKKKMGCEEDDAKVVGAMEEPNEAHFTGAPEERAPECHCDERGDECCGVTADRKSAAVGLIYELLGALGALGAESATAEERRLAPVSGCDEDARFSATVVARRADEAAKAGKADEADEADEAANATVTDKVDGRCTDHGALSCRADRADRVRTVKAAMRQKRQQGFRQPSAGAEDAASATRRL
jgi:hypothetical protein